MPEISRFYGIVVKMFYEDHEPPHFHVRYGDHEAVFSIRDLRRLAGWLPPRAQGLVVEWGLLNQDALMENWKRMRAREPLEKIPPLE